jgi:hypothetical protein
MQNMVDYFTVRIVLSLQPYNTVCDGTLTQPYYVNRRSAMEKRRICTTLCTKHDTSFVICLLSSVICHLSSVICHLSFVMCHLSFVICHVSSVICHLSCVLQRCLALLGHLPFAVMSWCQQVEGALLYPTCMCLLHTLLTSACTLHSTHVNPLFVAGAGHAARPMSAPIRPRRPASASCAVSCTCAQR